MLLFWRRLSKNPFDLSVRRAQTGLRCEGNVKCDGPWLITKKCVAEISFFFFPPHRLIPATWSGSRPPKTAWTGEVLFLISKCWEKERKKISALIKSRCAEHSVKERFVPETPVWNLKAGVGNRCDRFWIKSFKIMIKCCYLRTKCHERTLNLECLPPWATLLFRNTFLILIHFIKSIFYIIISPTLLLYSLYDILCAFIRFIVITIIAMNIKQLD